MKRQFEVVVERVRVTTEVVEVLIEGDASTGWYEEAEARADKSVRLGNGTVEGTTVDKVNLKSIREVEVDVCGEITCQGKVCEHPKKGPLHHHDGPPIGLK